MTQKLTSRHKAQSHKKMPVQPTGGSRKKNSRLWIIAAIFLAVAIIITAFLLFKEKSPTESATLPVNISVSDAAQRLKNGAYLLDVRTDTEWNEVHIAGAVLIPLDQLSTRIGEIPTDRDVLTICRTGNRSSQARDILRAAGLNRTTSISGGMNSWISAGLPVVTGP